MHGSFKKMLKESIHESQKCQRNWNLDATISEEDKKLILEAATNSPSKQNLNYFKLHVIEDRDIIDAIHDNTKGFGPIYHDYNDNSTTGHYREDRGDEGEFYTNSQVKANMLLAFVKNEPELKRQENDQYEEDRAMAIGLSAGYVNLIATQLGYSTGCCKCMDSASITNILGDAPILLMGVGVADKTRDRREHHDKKDFKFPSLKKMKNIETILHA